MGELKLGRQRSPEHHSGPHMRPYLRVANVHDASIELSDVNEMNFTPKEYETFRLKPGDVLLNEGQSLEWVGRAAIFRGQPKGACFQNTLIRFRAGPLVLPEFALLVFRYYVFSQRFRAIAKWTTNIAHLGLERLADVEFPLPPLTVQSQIVARAEERLSRLMVGCRAMVAAEKRLDLFCAAVLRQACEGVLGGREGASAWAEAPIGELSTLVTSGSRGWARFYSDRGPLFVRSQDINTDSLVLDGVAHVSLPASAEGRRTRICPGDLLVTITGANVTKCARVPDDIPEAYVSQHVALVRLRDPTLSSFLHLWMTAPSHGRGELLRAAYGAGKPGLNLDALRDLRVRVPPDPVRAELVDEVQQLLSVAQASRLLLAPQAARSRVLRTSILREAVPRDLQNGLDGQEEASPVPPSAAHG